LGQKRLGIKDNHNRTPLPDSEEFGNKRFLSGRIMLRKLLARVWQNSPQANLHFLREKLLPTKAVARNDMLDDLLALKAFPRILAWSLKSLPAQNICLLGYEPALGDALPIVPGKVITSRAWNWRDTIPDVTGDLCIVCRIPRTESDWNSLVAARVPNVCTLGEIIAPFSQILFLMKSSLNYFFKTPDENIPYYLGEDYFGPLPELNALFPLKGRKVIEFGPFDGYQTAGLTHLGANVTTIEARAENVVKTRAAFSALGLPVHIVMDDFHNVHVERYGRFDLAFAHGVYYHSIAPFVFLENLVSLSDNVFLGGFCATDALPASGWECLRYGGRDYRVKKYSETVGYTAGIHDIAYFFEAQDLMAFFRSRGYTVTVISDEPNTLTAGKFLRFLASRA
jgi:hypothetical protein